MMRRLIEAIRRAFRSKATREAEAGDALRSLMFEAHEKRRSHHTTGGEHPIDVAESKDVGYV